MKKKNYFSNDPTEESQEEIEELNEMIEQEEEERGREEYYERKYGRD
jgi:hypothetical protein